MAVKADEELARYLIGPGRRVGTWYGQLFGAAVFYLCYAIIRDLHGTASGHEVRLAYEHGDWVRRAEIWLHVDLERGIQAHVLPHRALIEAMNAFYALCHFPVTATVFAVALMADPGNFRRARNRLAVSTAIALVIFAVYPTMPPRMMPQYGYHDTLSEFGALWSYNHGAVEHISDAFAAMPSLHIVWATWCAVTLLGVLHSPLARLAAMGYPVVTAIVVLATGAHWLLDLVAGLAVFVLGCRLVDAETAGRVRPAPRPAPAYAAG